MSELKPCPFCGKTGRHDFSYPHPRVDCEAGLTILPSKPGTAATVQNCTATYKKSVDVTEIIEQVRAIKTPKPFCLDQYIKNEVVERVIAILERYR